MQEKFKKAPEPKGKKQMQYYLQRLGEMDACAEEIKLLEGMAKEKEAASGAGAMKEQLEALQEQLGSKEMAMKVRRPPLPPRPSTPDPTSDPHLTHI